MEDQIVEPIIGKEFPDKVIPLIESAKMEIDIIVYEWHFYPEQVSSTIQKFNQALNKAQRRGVKINAIIGKPQFSSIHKQNEIKLRTPRSISPIHAKMMIIDFEIAIIGSHNYSYSAFTINHEISLIIRDVNTVARLNKLFDTICY
jgi:phosphatidylserine/phosphatidylglycerophosphate/cardiolipin synthase-like enzyme